MMDDIATGRRGHVGLIELARPPHNHFDVALIRAIGDALQAFDADRDIRAVVLAAQGKSFCAGADFSNDGAFEGRDLGDRFAANFVKLGIHQGFGLSVTLPRLVGEQRAAELLLTGRRIGGEEARAIGLVDRLVPEAELREAAFAFAGEIAVNAPLAIVSIRATLRRGLYEQASEAMIRERTEQARLRRTDDAEEGLRAVADRRDGRFTGR